MARGKSKKPRQSEKLLMVLLDGHEASLSEVETTLGGQIEVYRLSTYLWNLKTEGADIRKIKQGRKIMALQLVNTDVMHQYALDRGLIAPPAVVLNPDDLMVAAG